MSDSQHKRLLTPQEEQKIKSAIDQFKQSHSLEQVASADATHSSHDTIDATSLSNNRGKLEVTTVLEDGLVAKETVAIDGKPMSELRVSAPTLESLLPAAREAVHKEAEYMSSKLPHALDARRLLEFDETSAQNLLKAVNDQRKDGKTSGPVTASEEDKARIDAAIQSVHGERLNKIISREYTTTSSDTFSLHLDKAGKPELTVTLKDGVRATETIDKDGHATSQVTFSAPSLDAKEISGEARRAVVSAVEEESRALRQPLDARHQLELEEITAKNLLSITQEQHSSLPPARPKATHSR